MKEKVFSILVCHVMNMFRYAFSLYLF